MIRILKPQQSLMLLLLAAGTASAFAQGKVNLCNDAASSIILNVSCANLYAADCGLAGAPIPPAGPLVSGIFLTAGLYAGTTPFSLSLVSSVIINPVGGSGAAPGMIPVTHVILPFPGGSLAYFQVKVWDANYATAEDAWNAWCYEGEGHPFTMTPGTSLAFPSITSGGGSTWQDGPILVPGWLDPPPLIVIDSQPASQTVAQGKTATFSVFAHSTYPLGYPLSYQWFFNNIAIPGATQTSCLVTNVQPTNAGSYSVSVHNSYYTRMSSNATLTVLLPPAIATLPQSQTAELGANVGFDVTATGDSPFFYHWFFNATSALGDTSTNSQWRFAGVQFSQSGAYSVVVTNGGGAVTSPPAMLNVIPTVERRPAAALNLNGVLNSDLNLEYTPLIDRPISWLPLESVLLTNPSQRYVDASSLFAATRFYRAWQTNGSPSIPAVNVIPAIILTGAIGSSVRIDCINQFGPIDAWTNLATVMLTNTSQLYFDTSSIGQPPRLWRIVSVP